MAHKPETIKPGHKKMRNKRLTIGYLTSWMHDPIFMALWAGLDDIAFKHDINLICFPGAPIQFPDRFVGQRNTIYDLITVENIDGLIMLSSSLATYISIEEFEAFYHKYQPLPIVSIGLKLKDVPSVVIDNKQGMRNAVTHLIETHGLSRIAFIQGREGHEEAEQRYQIYTDVLAEHGIQLNPDLILPGDFLRISGEEAVRILLEQRKLTPGAGFEAIIAANDDMAFGALTALQAHGVHVPNDVALVGFDDREESKCILPPLTTVRNPLYKLGVQAMEMLIAKIKGQDVRECVVLPSELVVRRSCGCIPPLMTPGASRSAILLSTEGRQVPLANQQKNTMHALVQALEATFGETGPEWAEQLLNAFAGEVEGRESKGTFLAILENFLYQSQASNFDVFTWHDALSALHDHTLPNLSSDKINLAEELLGRARFLVADIGQRLQGHQAIQHARQTRILSDIEYALNAIFNMAELLDTVAREIPSSGITTFYIALFEDPEAPADWSRLLLAYDGEKRIELETGGQRFPSRQLLPDGFLPVEKRYSLVVDLLYVRDRQIGFIIFKSKPSQGAVCEVLRRQISGAFHGVLLLHEREKAEAALEKAYADLKAAQQKLILKERLATLGKLAATVSHEIRNPLGTIRISASAVDRKTRDKGLGVEHALDRIQRNIIRCDNIISELLDYTRMPDLNLKLVSFDQWINRLLDEQILPGGITISREIVPDIKILLDAERFRRVIINLIDNALQAMLELPETSKQIRLLKVQSSVLGNRLKIIIADSGPGIPQDVMPHIFEPLYSTKSTGVGLGLSVVKGIIEQHGGRIKISSKPGKGVKVIVLLPLTQC